MPAKQFICPDGKKVMISECLQKCSRDRRCMFLPTLRAVADSVDRKISEATVTELLCGLRETYLKRTTDYAVDPKKQLYALHGTAVHAMLNNHTQGNMFAEERIKDNVTSGQFDLYGQIIDTSYQTLGDYKVTSSYKLMKALGYYKVDVPTGEVFKTGLRKGQMKTRKEWRSDGVRHLLDWAIQLNYYRILLEKQGFNVANMEIQALCRDFSLRIAAERNITQLVYIIPIKKISDHWIRLYMKTKAKRLNDALAQKTMPPVCSSKERWRNRKCAEYCDVADKCPYGSSLKLAA